MEATDAELTALAGQGDREAFAALVGRHQTLVCSVAFSVLGDFARSEDVGQEAFLAAWRQLPELREGGKFRTWICSIARNLALNAARRARPAESLGDDVAGAASEPPHDAAQREEQALVWRALEQLAPQYREPLVLYYRQDQSVGEVAQALDVSTDVVKQRLSRGRNLLRAEVAAMVESTLKRTTPTRAFTVAVLAALPAAASKSAAAAMTTCAASAAPLAVVGSMSLSGVLGAVFGTLFGLGGGAIGAWCSWSTAEYQSQRDFLLRQIAIYSVGMALFMAPFAAMMLGWRPAHELGPRGYAIAHGAWMTVFMSANLYWIFHGIRRWNAITAQEQARGAEKLPSARGA